MQGFSNFSDGRSEALGTAEYVTVEKEFSPAGPRCPIEDPTVHPREFDS